MKKLLLLLFSAAFISPYISIAQCSINAGSAQTVCAGQSQITLFATATVFTSFQWTTNGTGTFSNITTLNPIYTLSVSDMNLGNITLTITGTGGSCTNASSFAPITIQPLPVINVGSDQIQCEGSIPSLSATMSPGANLNWTTTGSGSFTNPTNPNSTYNPSQADIIAGSVILTATVVNAGGCQSSDQLTLTLLALPMINVGSDQIQCEGSTLSLFATMSSGANLNWTTTGSGSFTNPTNPNSSYVPSQADIIAGSVILTATVVNASGCQSADQLTLTLKPLPVITAGANQTVCEGSIVPLSAFITGGSNLNWTTTGTGTFTNPTNLNSSYIPSQTDITTGTITLKATAISTAGCVQMSSLTVAIIGAGRINAGPDQFISNGNASLSGTIINISSIEWSSNGSGIFTNPTALITTYTPSTEDRSKGIVKIKLTSTANGVCNAVMDELLVNFGTDFSMTGKIKTAANVLDNGVVLLFKQETTGLRFIKSDTIVSSDAGNYNFNHTPAGTYVLLASPIMGSSNMNTFLPTYYTGTQMWNTAKTVTISNNTVTDISLSPYLSADPNWNTGTDKISGLILLSENASANARTTAANVAAAYVTVFLVNATGDKIAYTQTDVDGMYAFDHVKAGTYYIATDFVGTELENGVTSIPVVVDGLASTVENLPITLVEKPSTTTGMINNTTSTLLRAYPNPTKNSVSIDVLNASGMGELKLFNEKGIITMQQIVDVSVSPLTLQIESLPAGIYVLQLILTNEIFTSKVVKY